MSHLLIVEDNPEIGDDLVAQLQTAYKVTLARSLAEADQALGRSSFDLVVLDVQLPDGDGFRYCGKIRNHERHRNVPVIFLTSQAALEDKILGFAIGADDYLSKPFHIEELRLRIAALLKRSTGKEGLEKELALGDLLLDLRYHKASVKSDSGVTEIRLTALEFKLLHFLASRDGEVCSRDQLIREIWGPNVHVTERTIDTHLSNLRKKLSSSAWTVQAVHGFGYHWTCKDHPQRKSG